MSPTDFISSIPAVLQFLLVLGATSGAVLSVITLWRHIKPNISVEIDKLRVEYLKEISSLRNELSKDFTPVRVDMERIITRVDKLEHTLAGIDIDQINRRFDRMENKIDDLTSLLVQTLTQAK